jgi:hypothetical protein
LMFFSRRVVDKKIERQDPSLGNRRDRFY